MQSFFQLPLGADRQVSLDLCDTVLAVGLYYTTMDAASIKQPAKHDPVVAVSVCGDQGRAVEP